MQRYFGLIVVCGALCFSQTPEIDRIAKALEPFRGLMESGQFGAAENLLREVLPAPKSEPAPAPGEDRMVSAYGLLWATVINAYQVNGDYDGAERVAKQMIAAAESDLGVEHLAVVAPLGILGTLYENQGRLAEAIPILERGLRLTPPELEILSRDTVVPLGRALLLLGRGDEARERMEPHLETMRKQPLLPSLDLWNTYAVVLRETGDAEGAAEAEEMVDADRFIAPKFYQADRDFLRARLLAARGSFDEADSIFRKWIGVFETREPGDSSTDWDRVLMKPLEEYSRFLQQNGRLEAAVAARSRLREIQRKHKIPFVK